MSTKLSTDLNITRSSTRLHAPPGGATSITFGDASTPPPPPGHNPRNVAGANRDTLTFGDPHSTTPATTSTSKKAAVAEPEPSIESLTTEIQSLTISNSQTVALVIAGSIGIDAIVVAVTKALVGKGIPADAVAVTRADDPVVLPFLVRRVAKLSNFKAILAVAVLGSESQLHDFLLDSILKLGLELTVPVVPAVVKRQSLLEIKALVPGDAEAWARSISVLLDDTVAFTAAPVVEVPVARAAVVDASVSDFDQLMDVLRESLKRRGATGIFGLARKFKIADDDKSGQISLAEFTKCMTEHALGWTSAQIKVVFDHFDGDKSGGINFDEFLIGVRGGLNDRRRQFVLQAFEILDSDKSGVIELNDIVAKYDGTKHPDVIAGKRTNEEVLREFLTTFDGDGNGKVTVDEFCTYYGNLSASIDLDDYFELMMRNAWHISGGEGWCANSSCRRVLVTHTDGRQTVEEIKNDLGVKADDKEAMKANLIAQGITDVLSIDTKGSTEGETPAAASASAAAPAGSKKASVHQDSNKRRAPGGASSIILG